MNSLVIASIAFASFCAVMAIIQQVRMTPEKRKQIQLGTPQPLIVCPFCQERGKVRTKPILANGPGFSFSKFAVGLFTCGLAWAAFGLSPTVVKTGAHCERCGNRWSW